MWCFFFFKQKTAYEMRISDWSSDVCSSDLDRLTHSSTDRAYWCVRFGAEIRSRRARLAGESVRHRLDVCLPRLSLRQGVDQGLRRSEEHTSELQSLMRISYAVFCFKTKKHKRRSLAVHDRTDISDNQQQHT